MKRRLFILGVFVLAGAVVNVAVAWGCALCVLFDVESYFDGSDGGVLEAEHCYQHWLVHIDARPGARHISSQWADRDLSIILSGMWPEDRPDNLIPRWAPDARPPIESESRGVWHYRWIDARGWPAPALRTGIACDTTTHANTDPVRVSGGIALDQPTLGPMRGISSNQRFIPFRAIWPGFAIDTLFYAALLWLPFAGSRLVRRRRRAARGLCPSCAYPAGTSAVCTECGKPVTPRSVEPVT